MMMWEYTTGRVQYHCVLDEIAQLQTSRGKSHSYMFSVLACGRGDDAQFARHNAAARAKEKIFDLKIAKADELLADASRNETFIADNVHEHCWDTTD
jgi:hypothetical protein